MTRLNTIEEYKRWKNGLELIGLEVRELKVVIQELLHYSKKLRDKNDKNWKEYFNIIHKIERFKGSASKTCELYRDFKKVLKDTLPKRCELQEIDALIKKATGLINKKHLKFIQNPKTKIIEENASCTAESLISHHHQTIQEHIASIERMESHFIMECTHREKNLRDAYHDTTERIFELEQKIMHSKWDAVTIYYAITLYKEYRERRREIKNEISIYYAITKTPMISTNKIKEKYTNITRQREFFVKKVAKEERVFQNSKALTKEEILNNVLIS